jgi:hypothetical protein
MEAPKAYRERSPEPDGEDAIECITLEHQPEAAQELKSAP